MFNQMCSKRHEHAESTSTALRNTQYYSPEMAVLLHVAIYYYFALPDCDINRMDVCPTGAADGNEDEYTSVFYRIRDTIIRKYAC